MTFWWGKEMRKELEACIYFLESVWVNTSLWIKVEPTGKDRGEDKVLSILLSVI